MKQQHSGYGAGERTSLQQELRAGRPLRCPRCDVALTLRDVPHPAGVPYVRYRVLVLCPSCHGSATLDRPH